jgi:hypothetical protein
MHAALPSLVPSNKINQIVDMHIIQTVKGVLKDLLKTEDS